MNIFTNYQMKFALKMLTTFVVGILFLNVTSAQISPSGQSKITAPAVLSACASDTVTIEFTNLHGPTCTGVPGSTPNISYSVQIPTGNTIVSYKAGSIVSTPAGATATVSGGNLLISAPTPSFGNTTQIKFAVQSTCSAAPSDTLPYFVVNATYPSPAFSITSDVWSSSKMNTGVAFLNTTQQGWNQAVNPIAAFNSQATWATVVTNTGYGKATSIEFNIVLDDSLYNLYGSTYNSIDIFTQVIQANGQGYPPYWSETPFYNQSGAIPGATVVASTLGGKRYYKVTLTGPALGSDQALLPGEYIYFVPHLKTGNSCLPDQHVKIWTNYVCATGGASCQKSDTINNIVKITAGTPIVSALRGQMDQWDGCPGKTASFVFKNTATYNPAHPEMGSAYDVDFNVAIGGLMQVSNLKIGGISIPTAQTIPGAVSAINWNIKNVLQNSGVAGLSDLDGDGYYDDIKAGDSVVVSWTWEVPCDLVCGKQTDYNVAANATFTDYCRKLNGSSSTPISHFGFAQTAPVAQVTPLPDYGTMGHTVNTKTARFGWNFTQNNLNLTNAVVKLRINYAKDMEVVEPISFLGVTRHLSDFTVVGTGFTPATGTTAGSLSDGANAVTDKDSALEYTLTHTELLQLFDNVGDSLVYSMTHIACDSFQNTTAKNTWNLLFQIGTTNCPTTGAPPCSIDLSCGAGFAYNVNQGCGNKPCYIFHDSLWRNAAIGSTTVAQTTPLETAPTNFYVGDTLTKRLTLNLSADYPQMEPIGSFYNNYVNNNGFRNYFTINYNRIPGTPFNLQPLLFVEAGSKVTIVDTTTNTVIATAPLLLNDFWTLYGGTSNNGATTQYPGTIPAQYDNVGPSDPVYGPYGGLGGYLCYVSDWEIDPAACPYSNPRYSQPGQGSPVYITNKNAADNRVSESYYLAFENALARAGYNFAPGFAKYKIIVDEKWYVNPAYPHTNTGQFLFREGVDRTGNGISPYPGTYMGICGSNGQQLGTIVTKDLSIVNPGATYNSSCGLTVYNELYLKSITGDAFPGGEVRVPYKLDSITITLPAEYHLTSTTGAFAYNQNGTRQTGTATASGINGHIVWLSTGTNGEFPRMTDQSGNNIVDSLAYTISNTGTDNFITDNYRVPVVYYLRDEFGKAFTKIDTINIVEGVGKVTVSPLGGSVQIADAGSCASNYMDLLLANNTLYTAGHVLLNLVGTANSTITGFKDIGTYLDPITTADTGTVNANTKYALVGALAPSEQRILRVYFTTSVCVDSIKVVSNLGCNYPASNNIYANSTTLDSAYIKYTAITPSLMLGVGTPKIGIATLCDTVDVIAQITNVKDPNLFNLMAGFKLPPNVKMVPGSAYYNQHSGYYGVQITEPLSYYDPFNVADITNGANPGDSIVFNVGNALTYGYNACCAYSPNYFYPGCGLPGPSDHLNVISTAPVVLNSYPPYGVVPNDFQSKSGTLNQVSIRFKVTFTACPATNNDVILVNAKGQNYCGTLTTGKAGINLIYQGVSGTPNTYSCKPANSIPVTVCGAVGTTAHVKDSMYVSVLTGAATSGADSVLITVGNDTTSFTLSNFTALGWGTPVVGKSAEGRTTLKFAVPAGNASGNDILLPLEYDMYIKNLNFCGTSSPLACSDLAFSMSFYSTVKIDCSSKGISCPGLGQVTRGAGVVPTDLQCCALASLGNRVWLDNNKDGLQTPGEPGVAGVTVTLYDANHNIVGSTITDAYGNYLFSNLLPGTYTVGFTPPANYSFTTQTNTTDNNNTGGVDSTGSDVNALGQSYPVVLSSGENNLNIDAGLIFQTPPVPNSIGDKVWLDTNGDGNQDAGEPGVAGVTVTLYDALGNIVAITTTDVNGNYIFNNLPPNTNYTVGFSTPPGTVLTSSTGTTVGNSTTNSDANPATGRTATINTGAPGNAITGIDAGLKNDALGAIGDFVWNDLNHDGIQDPNEPGVPGVVMNLYNVVGSTKTLVGTTTTDALGHYIFPNLPAGQYVVTATLPTGYNVTLDTVANTGGTAKDNNFAPTATPSVVTTGLYTLYPTSGGPGGPGVTRDMTVDLGIYNTTLGLNSIGDKVWNDINKDGLQTAGEPGVANITVSLLDIAGNPVNNPATGKPYVVTTDMNGNYSFVNLPDGNYKVGFSNLPPGFQFTPQNVDGAGVLGANNSDANTATGVTGIINLDATSASVTGVNITSVDAGISSGIPAGTVSLGNRVWYDVNNNGIQDAGETGVAGVTCTLLDASGNPVMVPGTSTPYVVTTDALGQYLFTGLPAGNYKVQFSNLPLGFTSSPANAGTDSTMDSNASFSGTSTSSTVATSPVYHLTVGQDNLTVDMGIVPAAGTNSIGDFVWNDTNADGLQTPGEPGVQGVQVTLYDSTGKAIAVTTTDANGAYSFVGLPDGNYTVGFSNLPAGLTFTTQTSNTSNGSDADPTTGRTNVIALDPNHTSSAGINVPSIDAGVKSTRAALGNYVWLDTNGDGIQDPTESGISGVTVTLYAADGVTVVASTITDANGKYLFDNLLPGSYVVGFGTVPSNLVFTNQSSPGDNGIDINSDVNPATGKTMVVNLSAGEIDTTIDAGLRPNIPASVGDFVWNDLNGDGIQNPNEPGVPGVLVTLKDANGNTVGTAITDGNGHYLISNVQPGVGYTITFSNLPAGATFTTQTSDVSPGDVTLGSDPNSSGVTAPFSLSQGQYLPTVDAGIKNIQLLPVNIVSFTAVPQGSSVSLAWDVASEINVAKYDVMYGTSISSLTNIGSVTAANKASYGFLHTSPAQGINYYKLRIVDLNGAVTYSDTRKVTFGNNTNIVVYPNPAKALVNISLTGSMINKPAVISLISMDGKMLLNKQISALNQTETLNVSGFASGKYLIRIATDTDLLTKTVEIIK